MLMRVDWLLSGRGAAPARGPERRAEIEARIRDLVAMINDFLDLARMEGVGLVIDAAEIDMNALVRVAVEELRSSRSASSLDLRVECCRDEACVEVDRGASPR